MTRKQILFCLGVLTAIVVYSILLWPAHAQTTTSVTIPAELQKYMNPAQGFLDFFMSDMFIWFWVLVVVAIVFIPFGIKGMIDVWRWANRNFFRPKSGQILIRQKLPNDRMREFWVKPTGKLMKFRSLDGKNDIEQPVKLEKGWMVFENNIPVVYLDEHNQQIQIGSRFQVSSVSQEEISRGYKASYETGKLIGSVDFFNDIKTWIIIMMVVTIMVGGINAYLSYSISQTLSKMKPMDEGVIAQRVVSMWLNMTSAQLPTGGQNLPVAGG